MRDRKEKARPAGGTAEQAKRDSHQAGGNPYGNYTTTQSGGQGTISRLLMEGANNGLHLQNLVRLTGLTEREVRLQIHAERRRGIPILSNSKDGYYLPGNEYEKAECVRQMRGRAWEILAAAAAVEKAVAK